MPLLGGVQPTDWRDEIMQTVPMSPSPERDSHLAPTDAARPRRARDPDGGEAPAVPQGVSRGAERKQEEGPQREDVAQAELPVGHETEVGEYEDRGDRQHRDPSPVLPLSDQRTNAKPDGQGHDRRLPGVLPPLRQSSRLSGRQAGLRSAIAAWRALSALPLTLSSRSTSSITAPGAESPWR